MSYMNLLCLLLKIWNKRMQLLINSFLLAILLLSVMSCSLLSGSITTSYNKGDDTEKLIRERGLYINSIIVSKNYDSETVRENAFSAFTVLLGPQVSGDESRLGTEAVFKEESFIKGFNQLNTVSLELTVKNKNGEIIKKVLIAEDSENTLSSYRFLYKIIQKGIKETGFTPGEL